MGDQPIDVSNLHFLYLFIGIDKVCFAPVTLVQEGVRELAFLDADLGVCFRSRHDVSEVNLVFICIILFYDLLKVFSFVCAPSLFKAPGARSVILDVFLVHAL